MKFPRFYYIKKLDRFIIKAFLKNLMATFFICLFIFIIQLLWMWINDFVDKGLDLTVISQFFLLGSVSLVSKALPLAILLAALMTFGNMGEKLELLAIKSAGVPLIRTMVPLIICCLFFGGISFCFQNIIAPMAQKKLVAMMYSIKQASPESDIPERIFYNKINGYNLYVNRKDKETGMLYDVTIYDMSAGFEKANILVADSAILRNTADDKNMILSIFSGEQFSNLDEQNINKKNAPYRRETFIQKDLVIETEGGFEMKNSDFLKTKADGKNMKELVLAIDSLGKSNDSIARDNLKHLKRNTYNARIEFNKSDSVSMINEGVYSMNIDSIYNVATQKAKLNWKRNTLRNISSVKNTYDINNKVLYQLDKDLNKHKISWWQKITLSLGCIIFLVIGAPLGSIVKKGGLGYPIIISVATFILYYIFDTSGSKMASEGEWEIWFGSWLSTMILVPLGLFFTYQANKDSGILKNDTIKEFFRRMFAISEKRNIQLKDIIIDEPDYSNCRSGLKEIYRDIRLYKIKNKLKKLPSLKKVFFNEKNNTILDINERLEDIIEILSQSRSRKIIINLNEIPILMPKAISSPFKYRIINILLCITSPFNIFVYIRAIRFRVKLYKDLTKVEAKIRDINQIIKKEQLINPNTEIVNININEGL